MQRLVKPIVLSIVLACLSAALFNPEIAHCQTTKKSVQGTWVTTGGGGFSNVTLQFDPNSTYSVVYTDNSGNKVEDAGKYSIVAETVLIAGNSGERAKMYFFWTNPNAATIRIVPDGSAKAVEQPFVRIR